MGDSCLVYCSFRTVVYSKFNLAKRMIELVKNCKHDQGYTREEVAGHTYARCNSCGVVHRVIANEKFPADWSKEGAIDE